MITSKVKKAEKGSHPASESGSVDRHASRSSSSSSSENDDESSSESSSSSETESRSSVGRRNQSQHARSSASKLDHSGAPTNETHTYSSNVAGGTHAAHIATAAGVGAGAGAIAGHQYNNKQSTDSQGHYLPTRSGDHFQGHNNTGEHQYSDIPPPPPLPPPKSSHRTKGSDIPPPPPLDQAPDSGNKKQKAQQPSQNSSQSGSKSRRWNPFTKKEVPPQEVNERIQQYQLKADEELQKSQLASNKKDQEKATLHNTNAPFGSRFTSFFKRFGHWNAERNHKSAHETYLDKISHLQTKRTQQQGHVN